VNPRTLLSELRRRGVQISAESDQLVCRAPSGALTPDLRQALQEQKPALLELLRQEGPVTTTSSRIPFRSAHERISEQSRRTPDAVALAMSSRQWSYRDLEEQANGLAHHLIALGARPGVLVGLFLERSVDAVVSMLAVVKSGAAFLPLDPAYPRSRLTSLLADAGPRLVVTNEHYRPGLPATDLCVCSLDADGAAIAALPTTPPQIALGPEDVAYVIFTSGSTGRPKGVLVPHRGLVNLVQAQRAAFEVRRTDRVLQFAPLSFDASVSEVFVTLSAGATLVLASGERLRPGRELHETLRDQRVSMVTLPPSVLAVLPEGLPELRTVISAGESLTIDIADRWSAGRRLLNAYGPTENTVCATVGEYQLGERVTIGKPLPNVQVYVLDEQLRPCPVGVPGELYLGGVGVARGYLGRPALTADRFIPDPYGGRSGARLYRTGDLGRWQEEGELEYLGRSDEQVKVRGVRIEPGEVEAALREHPGVTEAVVVARDDGGAGKRLVAYFVPAPGEPPTGMVLRAFLQQRLPESLVPSLYVLLDEMPRTTSGKIDRKNLPAPSSGNTGGGRPEFVAPKNPLQEYLAGKYRDFLGVERVGIHDSFFDLGGDSIRGAVLINAVQKKLKEYVYAVAIFDAPTVAGLAQYLGTNNTDAVRRHFGDASLPEEGGADTPATEARITHFQSLVRSVPARRLPPERRRNPMAAFILSAPRSGSTLLRVMLGGHPRLFAPPELQLLNFDTLSQRRAAFDTSRDQFWLDGGVRAVMQLFSWDAGHARSWIEFLERANTPIGDFYGLLQRRLGNRLLVDKTPWYALDPACMARAEDYFEGPKYIHLIRHPAAMAASYEEAKLQAFLPGFLNGPHGLRQGEQAEVMWYVCQRNILAFLERIPAERQFRVHFEDLVQRPHEVSEELAGFLGVEFHPAMLEPHKERKERMTDGVAENSKMLGDIKFHHHRGIDPKAAERWRSRGRAVLGEITWRLAETFGYERPPEEPPAEQSGPMAMPLGGSTVVPLQPAGSRPPLFCIHPASGTVYGYRALAAALGKTQPLYGLQYPGLFGGADAPTRLEDIAEVYLRAILEVRPEGPYHLAGHSMGGLVAFEIARRLSEQGREVGAVALFDARIVEGPQREIEAGSPWWLALVAGEQGLEVTPQELEPLEIPQRIDFILERAQRARLLPPGIPQPMARALFEQFIRVYQTCELASRDYYPGRYEGTVHFFHAKEVPEERRIDPMQMWAPLVGELIVHPIASSHAAMLAPPHLRVVVERLRAALDCGVVPRRKESSATAHFEPGEAGG
jgi:amino acid adenylation domain-containing protein